ncbi:unnamed protein product [Calypogeia fissa]
MEMSWRVGRRNFPAVIVFVLLMLCIAKDIHFLSAPNSDPLVGRSRRLMRLEKGPFDDQHNILLSVVAETLPVYIIWYGNFIDVQRSIVLDFFNSFNPSRHTEEESCTSSGPPSVRSWWKTATRLMRPLRVQLESDMSDASYSKGTNLSNANVQELVLQYSVDTMPENPNAIYLLLTSEDVTVEGFCANSCASRSQFSVHKSSPISPGNGIEIVSTLVGEAAEFDPQRLVQFAWVGNAATQCAEECAWPLAKPDPTGRWGMAMAPILPPNEDLGMDGMIISIAATLAGAASYPPFHDRSDELFPEGVVASSSSSGQPAEGVVCRGVFGEGAYPGYQGHLWKEKGKGTSFNTLGANDRRFLLPALWDPATLKCRIPS